MSEPLRERFLETVRSAVADRLTGQADWGTYPTGLVDRRYRPLTNLGDRFHVGILDDDGSWTPTPEDEQGNFDERVNFLLVIQVMGDDVDPPSRWGQRVLHDVKAALIAGGRPSGTLWPYTKLRIEFEPESVIQSTDGRLVEYQVPCTARLPENLGAFA